MKSQYDESRDDFSSKNQWKSLSCHDFTFQFTMLNISAIRSKIH